MASPVAAVRDAVVDTAGSGDNTIVAAVANKRFVVTSYVLVAGAAVAVRWKSGATSKSGAMSLSANGGIAAPGTVDSRWFATAIGEALILNLGGAVQVSGHVSYREE